MVSQPEDEHPAGEIDATLADGDQTLADVDASLAEQDQLLADRDQRAADVDQAAADQDLAAGRRTPSVLEVHARTRRLRALTTLQRDRSLELRIEVGRKRDANAVRRDRLADQRDVAEAARDAIAEAAEAHVDDLDEGTPLAQAHARATRARVRAAETRRTAAARRAVAARDRAIARSDRALAAEDRVAAEEDLDRDGTDALTGVLRRRPGRRSLDVLARRRRHADLPCAVAYVDLLGLAATNAAGGPVAGDERLRVVATRLTELTGPGGLVIRYAGDEFVCVAAAGDVDALARLLEGASPIDGAGLTVGYAGLRSDDEPALGLVERARSAMLARRTTGRA